jgi:DNA repair ATPase RecN
MKLRRLLKKQVCEIKKTTQGVKEEYNEGMECLREKSQTEILEIRSPLNELKNTVKVHSSRLEQVEDRISRLKDKIDIY